MSRGRHAADDASFAKSAGAAASRGLLLLVLAAVIGLVLYRSVEDVPPGTDVSAATRRTTTTEAAGEAGEVISSTTVPLRQPKDIKVLVANGAGVSGLGGQVSERLRTPHGYNVLSPVNAPARVQTTTLFYTPGFDREAAKIAEVLGLPPTTVKPMPAQAPVPDTRGANVVVLAGPELNAAAPATTTTARGATTTTAAD